LLRVYVCSIRLRIPVMVTHRAPRGEYGLLNLSGMPKVNRDHLFAFRAWLPDIQKQKLLAIQLDALSAETRRLAAIYERKLAALEALKSSLLQRAFAGAL